jgi:hypothetical protein
LLWRVCGVLVDVRVGIRGGHMCEGEVDSAVTTQRVFDWQNE